MKMAYTVAVREKGDTGPFRYISAQLKVQNMKEGCSPLTMREAREAKKLLIEGARKKRRPIECRIEQMKLPR